MGFHVTELPKVWRELNLNDRYRHDGPNSGNCLHATRVALEVCQHYGVEAEPIFGAFMAFNPKGWRNFEAATPTDQWPPQAWSVGVMLEEPNERTVGGHAFVNARQDGKAYIIDLAASQASRPARGIHLEPQVLDLGEAFDLINWAPAGECYVWRTNKKTVMLYSGGTSDWPAPWNWAEVPTGYQLDRNQPEIDDMIRAIDAKHLQL